MKNIKDFTTNYNCHLCGSDSYSLLHDKGHCSRAFNNYICNKCGFVFVLPRPETEEFATLYEKGKLSKTAKNLSVSDDRKFLDDERTARSRLFILERELGNYLWSQDKHKSVLEVGCGTGSFLRLLRACGWEVVGLEPDAVYSEAGQKRYGIPIHNQFIEDFDVEEGFDLVCSFHVIEKVEDPNVFLANIHPLLLDGGYLYLECPSIERWDGEKTDLSFNDVCINTFSQKTLSAFLAKNGFRSASSGWNRNRLWVLAKKDKAENLKVTWDSPKRIHRIVAQATSKYGEPLAGIQLVNRAVSLLDRGINLAKNNPSQFSVKVREKIQRRLKLPISLGNRLLNAYEVAVEPATPNASKLRVVHVGIHTNGANGGDTLLFPAVRWLFQNHLAPTSFTLLPLHKPVTQETIEEINRHDALLIGGGGVLLPDTNHNNLSGWQWACPTELLEKIKVPIIVFAVGYNRFRGQSEFAPIFTKSICKLVEKSTFFGLRNHGSIEEIKSYLPEELHAKLSFQPCPTTVLSRFYPGIPVMAQEREPIIAVNIAFDRHHLRFGESEDQILWEIAETLLSLQERGWKPTIFNHSPEDRDARFWFRAKGLFIDEVNLFGVPPQFVIEKYSKVSLSLGMRGHAQMIPFGLKLPILSLISHNKLRFFLDDIMHSEWGVEVKSQSLGDSLLEKIHSFRENRDTIQIQVLQAQEKLWQKTLENLELIKQVLKVYSRSQ